jgi:hypothetical protein
MTHGNTHNGDKRGKATLKKELTNTNVGVDARVQCTRETLAMTQDTIGT